MRRPIPSRTLVLALHLSVATAQVEGHVARATPAEQYQKLCDELRIVSRRGPRRSCSRSAT